MTKRKTTATGLPKTSGDNGKPFTAFPVGYSNLLTDLKVRVTHHFEAEIGNTPTKQHGF